MKLEQTQQEILLVLNTTFSSRECQEKNSIDESNCLTEREKLLAACWNGLLQEILPEIFEQDPKEAKLCLWQVKEASSFLELELGNLQEIKDIYLSIDPYTFLAIQYCN